MSVKLSIKDLRRAETELESEMNYVVQCLSAARSERTTNNQGALEAGLSVCDAYVTRQSELLGAVFAIRQAVGKFNEDEGINQRTGRIAYLERLVAANEKAQSFGRVARNQSYGSTEVTYTPGIDDEKINVYRNEVRRIRREIQSLKDSCNGINSSKDATPYIDPKMVEFLKSNNFIG